jgi:hypothetical protein
MLAAKIPHPRPEFPVCTVKRQRADHDAVGLRLIRVHRLAGQTRFTNVVFPALPQPTTIGFTSRSGGPFTPRVAK